MSDDKAIREDNLILVCNSRKLWAKDLAQLVRNESGQPTSETLWYDILRKKKPSFGEKLARRVEEGLQLPRGFLDLPRTEAEVSAASVSGAKALKMLTDPAVQLALAFAALPADPPNGVLKTRLLNQLMGLIEGHAERGFQNGSSESSPSGRPKLSRAQDPQTRPGKARVSSKSGSA